MPPNEPKRGRARELAGAHLARGDALGWFEPLYAEARGNPQRIPWADMAPNPHLVEWLDREAISGDGRCALVVGCGLGDDAELLKERGFRVTAFDLSSTAIEWCRTRFPLGGVAYEAADLLNPPLSWKKAFDFVFEAYTLQVLPGSLRPTAIEKTASFLGMGGTLLVVCRGREPDDPEGQMPWPLLRVDLSAFEREGLRLETFEEHWDRCEEPPVRRFRASFRRPV